MTILAPHLDTLRQLQPRQVAGTVVAVRGLTILVEDLSLPVGTLVRITPAGRAAAATEPPTRGEVVGFDGKRTIVMLFGASHGIAPGAVVIGQQSAQTVQVGRCMLGRIIDALGQPMDDGPPLADTIPVPLNPPPLSAMQRQRVTEPLPTGVRAVDSMITLGKGQSTLLATIARNTDADVNVIALVGERGREVREFIEETLGEEGLRRSVVVVATGDESPLLRVRAALIACSVAEHFRSLGSDVMFIMDSVTRFAQAQRQIGLTVGEQPATKGYTPSVFAMLPVLLERAGAVEGGGSITGLYAVLVEGDDLTEPVSDAVRGILDGHIALSRKLASRGHYPAIDVLESVSRVADAVTDENHRAARQYMQRMLAAHAEAEELINIGAYVSGSNPDCDVAIAMKPKLDAFLQQTPDEHSDYPQTCRRMIELTLEAGQHARSSANHHRGAGQTDAAQRNM